MKPYITNEVPVTAGAITNDGRMLGVGLIDDNRETASEMC